MSSGITTFTALKLDDKDLNDPNSGFYTAQATTDQINSIPADSKEAGELLYNKTTGNLMLFSNGAWNMLNSYPGFTRPVIAMFGSNSTESNSGAEGEQIYYMPLDSANILKAEDFTLPDNSKNEILYTGTNSIVVHYTVALGIIITTTESNVVFNLYLNNQDIMDRIALYEVIANSFYRLSFTRSIILNTNDVISCGIETANVGYNLLGTSMTLMSI